MPNMGPQFKSMSDVALSMEGPKYASIVPSCKDENVMLQKHWFKLHTTKEANTNHRRRSKTYWSELACESKGEESMVSEETSMDLRTRKGVRAET